MTGVGREGQSAGKGIVHSLPISAKLVWFSTKCLALQWKIANTSEFNQEALGRRKKTFHYFADDSGVYNKC